MKMAMAFDAVRVARRESIEPNLLQMYASLSACCLVGISNFSLPTLARNLLSEV